MDSLLTFRPLRPTSNRAYIRYDHTIYCFQFVRVRLKSERKGVEYSSTPGAHFLIADILRTTDRTAVIVSTLYCRSAFRQSVSCFQGVHSQTFSYHEIASDERIGLVTVATKST